MGCSRPVTPRAGYAVEINALWYNAVSYTLALAAKAGDKPFVAEWKDVPKRTKASFLAKFWLADKGYLADCNNGSEADDTVRCNQIVACGLDYTMLDDKQRVDVLMKVRKYLLTPKGLRSLSPQETMFESQYKESPIERETAACNGGVWVWPLMFYIKCAFDLEGTRFLPTAHEMLDNFDDDIQSYCIGSIAEYYDPNPPFASRGAISMAWSVGGVLYIKELIDRYEAKAKRSASKTKKTNNKK